MNINSNKFYVITYGEGGDVVYITKDPRKIKYAILRTVNLYAYLNYLYENFGYSRMFEITETDKDLKIFDQITEDLSKFNFHNNMYDSEKIMETFFRVGSDHENYGDLDNDLGGDLVIEDTEKYDINDSAYLDIYADYCIYSVESNKFYSSYKKSVQLSNIINYKKFCLIDQATDQTNIDSLSINDDTKVYVISTQFGAVCAVTTDITELKKLYNEIVKDHEEYQKYLKDMNVNSQHLTDRYLFRQDSDSEQEFQYKISVLDPNRYYKEKNLMDKDQYLELIH
jgi:hypothetical protein